MLKKVLTVLIILLPWFISGLLFSGNFEFYDTLTKPFYALPNYLFAPVWTILYVLITISVFRIVNRYSLNSIKEYRSSLIYNYIFNQLFLFFFFTLKNPFLGFVDAVLIFITSLFLYYETKELDTKASKFLLPYVFFNVYAVILSLSVYFLNL